jgi:hypothetical protein
MGKDEWLDDEHKLLHGLLAAEIPVIVIGDITT